ncbi:MAG: sialate O-acetylesterase [Armatimonadota bacterium]|nr:sialate O-acetylesterase [Armatimonadota bacterium]MCX7778493.1 sialate O-acetylesterase [Armatimonadota bacterium]MDW8025619.1 sialate O-acetylesterase [Armatimonadota bacterium]
MRVKWAAALLICVFARSVVNADIKLPSLFSDRMVLQRGTNVAVWGEASPNERLTIRLSPQDNASEGKQAVEVRCTASANGAWKAYLPPMQSGGPYELTVSSDDGSSVRVRDVMIGDVWICSGQSNMEWSVANSANAEQEIANANYPNIRLFMVRKVVSDVPVDDPKGEWKACSPETVRNFSAVGYFFARELYQHLKVPIGMIQAAWGGTPAESWTSTPTLELEPELRVILDNWKKVVEAYPEALKRYEERLKQWEEEARKAKEEGKPIPRRPNPPMGPGHPWQPSGLFNGMIAPLTKFAIKGVIWYQGESNTGRAAQYRKLFPALINDWRKAWGIDFPFLFVQLANFMQRKPEPSESAWAELREAQLLTLLKVPRTGMAVAIDIGEANDIHPKNKQDVGKRLSLAARAIAYGESIVYSGPIYDRMVVENSKIRIYFKHVGSGLVAKDEKLTGFAISGEDGKFVWAEAEIDGDTVVVWSQKVDKPVAVRYAWADNPDCNLYNKEGLPASPFRTDMPIE